MSKTISFKLSDEEYDALLALQSSGEKSPSLIAKRIVCQALSLPESTQSTAVYHPNIDERVDSRIEEKLIPVLQELVQLKAALGESVA